VLNDERSNEGISVFHADLENARKELNGSRKAVLGELFPFNGLTPVPASSGKQSRGYDNETFAIIQVAIIMASYFVGDDAICRVTSGDFSILQTFFSVQPSSLTRGLDSSGGLMRPTELRRDVREKCLVYIIYSRETFISSPAVDSTDFPLSHFSSFLHIQGVSDLPNNWLRVDS